MDRKTLIFFGVIYVVLLTVLFWFGRRVAVWRGRD